MVKLATEQRKKNGLSCNWKHFSAKVVPAPDSTNLGQPLHSECVIFLIMLYLHGNIQSIGLWALTLAQDVRAFAWQVEGCWFDPPMGMSKCPFITFKKTDLNIYLQTLSHLKTPIKELSKLLIYAKKKN